MHLQSPLTSMSAAVSHTHLPPQPPLPQVHAPGVYAAAAHSAAAHARPQGRPTTQAQSTGGRTRSLQQRPGWQPQPQQRPKHQRAAGSDRGTDASPSGGAGVGTWTSRRGGGRAGAGGARPRPPATSSRPAATAPAPAPAPGLAASGAANSAAGGAGSSVSAAAALPVSAASTASTSGAGREGSAQHGRKRDKRQAQRQLQQQEQRKPEGKKEKAQDWDSLVRAQQDGDEGEQAEIGKAASVQGQQELGSVLPESGDKSKSRAKSGSESEGQASSKSRGKVGAGMGAAVEAVVVAPAAGAVSVTLQQSSSAVTPKEKEKQQRGGKDREAGQGGNKKTKARNSSSSNLIGAGGPAPSKLARAPKAISIPPANPAPAIALATLAAGAWRRGGRAAAQGKLWLPVLLHLVLWCLGGLRRVGAVSLLSFLVSLLACGLGLACGFALSVTVLVVRLHGHAARAAASGWHAPICFLLPCLFRRFALTLAGIGPHWTPVCLWYFFLVQAVCGGVKPESTWRRMLPKLRLMLPVLLVIQGASGRNYVVDLSDAELLLLALILCAARQRCLLSPVFCLTWLIQALAVSVFWTPPIPPPLPLLYLQLVSGLASLRGAAVVDAMTCGGGSHSSHASLTSGFQVAATS
ncbi:unnamed protein product [Chrysoparadoxa australica]